MPEGTTTEGVLTFRQYLAATAPKVPWESFQVEVPPKPPTQYKDGRHPAQVGVDEAELTEESKLEQEAWLKERAEKRLRQWPWYYADAVIRGGVEYDRLTGSRW